MSRRQASAFEWGSVQDDEEEGKTSVGEQQQQQQDDGGDDGFQEATSKRKKKPLAPKQDDVILLFQDAYSNPSYSYTKQIVRSYQDLERIFSRYESKRCQQKGIAYKYTYYHGYSIQSQVVWSFHHGEMREHKKLAGDELAVYIDKIRPCFDEYKRPCRECQGPRADMANGISFCFACNTLSLKK